MHTMRILALFCICLDALQAAEHFDWKASYLLLHSKGIDKPLRFTRLANPQK
jgi:hypothetical protein